MSAPTFGTIGTLHAATTSTPAFAVPASVASGDIIVVAFFADVSTTTISTFPTGFAAAENSPRTVNAGGAGNHAIHVAWKRATGADTGTYTFTLSASVFVYGNAVRYTGAVASGNPWDSPTAAGDGGNTGSTTTPDIAVTTAGPDRMLFFAGSNFGGDTGTWTAPTGFSERQGGANTTNLEISDKVQAAQGGSGNTHATLTVSDKVGDWLGALIGTTVAADSIPVPPPPIPPWLLNALIARIQGQVSDPPSTQVTADTALAAVGVAATSTVAKVAVATGTTPVGLTATGTGKKVSADTGTVTAGLSANAIHVQVSAETGLAELGLAATTTVKKVAVVACTAPVGLSATVAAKKASKNTGTAPAGLVATGTAVKVSKDTGAAAAGLVANAVHVPATADTGLATVGLTASGTAKKVAVTSAVCSVGLASAVTAKHVAKAAQTAALGVCGLATVRKVARTPATGYAGVVARFAGIDLRSVTGRAFLGLRAQQHQCITYRSNIGTTLRPSSGTTAYALATTARPNTGTTARPNSGSTEQPC